MTNEFIVLAYILKNPKALTVVGDKIQPFYFSNKALRTFYKVILKAHGRKMVVTFPVLDQILRKKKYKKSFYDTYSELMNYENRDGEEFSYSLKQLLRDYKKRLLVKGVTNVSQDLLSDDLGKAESQMKKIMKNMELAKLESDGVLVNIRKDVDESKELYEDIERSLKEGDDDYGRVKTGLNFVDAITGGGARGELWIWGGYTGDGKTQMSKEIGYRVCTMYGKNVLFVSLEMSPREVKNMVEIRHSHNFINGGLLTKRLELGTFTPQEKKAYMKTLKDWNRNKKYGKFILWSPPYGCSVEQFAIKLEQISYKTDIDLVIVDYAELLSLPRYIKTENRIQVKYKMEQIKDIARTFNGNKGIWMFSPHQISRGGKEKAIKRGHYILADLAESAGVERTANFVGWSLVTPELKEEGKVRIGISKYRTGKTDERGSELMADFAHSLITELDDETYMDDSELN